MAIKPLLIVAAVAGLAGCSKEPPTPSTATTAPRAEAPAASAPAPLPAPQSAPATGATARDSAATEPTGTLNKREEQTQMPMAGHGNNHSSPALDAKTPPKQ